MKIIKEGQAQLQLPKTVFYNPVQEFNRDLSVLVVRTFLKHNVWHHRSEERFVKGRGGMKILDALSASGLRSIRYAKELGEAGNIVKKIVANDLSDSAVDLIKKNIELNNVGDKVECSKSDAAHLLYLSSTSYDDKFHVIDLDPFGTAAQFLDASVKGISDAGLLMVTCTDAAVLCGNAGESCFARYGSMSLKGEFCHDQALRIVLRSIESHAAIYGKYIKPLLSISVDFYVRLFVQVFNQQVETKKSASKLSQIYLCKECKTTELNPLGTCQIKEDPKQAQSKNLAVNSRFRPAEVLIGDRCLICGGKYTLGGPIWSAPIHDRDFLDLLKQEIALEQTEKDFATFRRIQGLVYMCSEELNAPLMFSIQHMASLLRMKMPRTKDLKSALMNEGYQVSATHTNINGLKTNAPSSVIWGIFCQIAHSESSMRSSKYDEPRDEEASLFQRIMRRCYGQKSYNLAYNPAIETESQKLSLMRFQVNPEPAWGPKPRPVGPKREADGDATDVNETKKARQDVLGEEDKHKGANLLDSDNLNGGSQGKG